MSWDDVRRLLWQAHRPSRERGMDFGSGRLAPEELERRVGTPGLCLIAYADGVPAGTASLDIRDLQTGGQTVRCGLCHALLCRRIFAECEKPARALLCRRLHVGTHPRNQRAIDLFLRLGYRRPDPDKAAFVKELG